MSEQLVTSDQIASEYNFQAEQYSRHADKAYSWTNIERPAFDSRIADLYNPQTRVIDLGCGTGTVIRHLTERGIEPRNITGVDVSSGQLEQARSSISTDVTLFHGSIDQLDIPLQSVDLVVCNMMLHYLDNETLGVALDSIYDKLVTGGTFFFVATDPDHNERGRDEKFDNTWSYDLTPWGTTMPFFNRSARKLLTGMLDLHGFDYVNGGVLNVVDEQKTDWKNYIKYANRRSRMAGRYKTVSRDLREKRMSGRKIPSLI